MSVLLLAELGPAAARADWSGDGAGDVLAVDGDGRLLLYRGDGTGRFAAGTGEPIGTSWQQFTALLAPGDFSGDGASDLFARTEDGTLLMYRGRA